VNTSFNVRGEPIVGTREDAFRCFMGTGIDALAVENCFLQDASAKRNYSHEFVADYLIAVGLGQGVLFD
jgi:carbamoyltransferase